MRSDSEKGRRWILIRKEISCVSLVKCWDARIDIGGGFHLVKQETIYPR